MKRNKQFLASVLAGLLIALEGCGSSSVDAPALPEAAQSPALAAQPLAASLAVASYGDVAEDAWYAADVAYVTEHGIMDAAAEDSFLPGENAIRLVIAEGLWRAAGKPAAGKSAGFPDMDAASVDWAAEKGVTNGYDDGRFHGDDPVTREQFAAMLWRAADKPEPEADALGSFPDWRDISAYALNAAIWAQENGIINGRDNGMFDAKANVTRAEVAAILHRYLTGPGAADASGDHTSVVYFTSDISAEGLVAVYEALGWNPAGKVAVKVSTGEPPASNYLRPELIGDLVRQVDGTIVECNTAYGGSRSSSAMHKQVAADHGFTSIAEFDLTRINRKSLFRPHET